MSINALSTVANRALGGIGRAVRDVEQVATEIAGAVDRQSSDSTSEAISAVTRLPGLKQQVLANVKVIEISEQLLRELYYLPRR